MAERLSMTLPDAYMAALVAKGAPLGLDGQEYLKQYVRVVR